MIPKVTLNNEDGLYFERIFRGRAEAKNFLVIKHHLSGHYISNSRFVVVHGELDFKIMKNGQAIYIDCKNVEGLSVPFSFFKKEQLNRAVKYNAYGFVSGFVILFRAANKVVYFSGAYILKKGPRKSFQWSEGIQLGSTEYFDLDILASAKDVFVK